ncbi:MAG: tetratricopeptide repeat protein, partial [Candidatus Tectomicrobia bacterium]|nr:tetratricopeptide repeat protein [Candidatus Tectomicrobia bacterium]
MQLNAKRQLGQLERLRLCLLILGYLLGGCGSDHTRQAERLLANAQQAVEERNYGQAAAWLGRFKPEHPKSKAYYLLKGVSHFKLREFDQAIAAFEHAQPSSLALTLHLAYIHLIHNDFERANTLAAGLVSQHGPHPDVSILVGNIRLRERRYDAARTAFAQALEGQGDPVKSYVGLANVALLERDFAQAEEQFLKAVLYAEQDAYAYVALSKYYLAMQRYADAEITLQLALNADPEDINLVILLSNVLIQSEQYEKALVVLRAHESDLPYSHVIQSQIIRCLFFLKKYDEAYRILTAVDDHSRDHLAILTGEYYLRTHQMQLASSDFHSAISINHDYLENYYMGLTAFIQHDDGLALKYLEESVRQHTAFVKAHLLITALHVWKGNYAAALKHARLVIRLQPKNIQAYILQGITLYLQGYLSRADYVFDLVSKLEPQHPVPYLFAASMLRSQQTATGQERRAHRERVMELVSHLQAGYIETLFLQFDAADGEGGAPPLADCRADAFWQSFLQQNDTASVALLIADYYQQRGDTGTAASYLRHALDRTDRCALCYYQLAHIETLQGHREQAIGYLIRTLQLDARFLEAYQALGVLYEAQRDYVS